jgi:uncharacterized protein YqfA (UPF0365 family)
MANSFFKSIKNAFVTEIPDETPSVVEEKNVVQTPHVVQSVAQTPQSMFISTASAPKAIEGQVDDELLQKLCQAMEDSNLPGPDYLELKNVANNEEMKRAMPNEIQRLTVAFITMKSSSPEMTKERVLNSIDSYIQMMENERKAGHEQLDQIWNVKVESQRAAVSEAEHEIASLQQRLQERIEFVRTKTNEIAEESNKCNINKANFDATVDFLVNNLANDKTKLSSALV